MKLSFECSPVDLNWSAVVELPARLKRCGLIVNRVSIQLRKFPESVELDSLDQLPEYVSRKGSPNGYRLVFYGAEGKTGFTLTLIRGMSIRISLESINPDEPMKSAMEFLGLSLEEPSALPGKAPRTAFLAHRFDAPGLDAADKVALCKFGIPALCSAQ